jgi:heterodisulfide reductase subunit A
VNIAAKAVLVASGFQLFDATKKEEYGYGVYDHVITNADLEAWMNGNKDKRVPRSPKAIGFVHCVGSRDLKAGNSQCSKVCCMTAVKQAIEMKEQFSNAEVYCFYMDLRLFGKKYEDFYINAQRDFGVHFIRGRVSEVSETIDGRVQVKAEDTLLGKPLKIQLDLLVLMAGMSCNPQVQGLVKQAKLEIDSDGFLKSEDNIYSIIESGRPGIFFAGACTGTKTVPETVAEARAVALAIHNYLNE